MFETAMFLVLMEKLQERCHRNSKDKGFWDGEENQNIPSKLALIHSEVSEWLEAYRTGPTEPCGKKMPHPYKEGEMIDLGIIDGSAPEGPRPLTKEEEEAADILIRLCDLCEYRGIDLGRVTIAKMHYNASRPKMHGGKRI